MREKYEDDFRAGMGAEAIKELLAQIDLEKLYNELMEELENASGQKRIRITQAAGSSRSVPKIWQ